MNVYYKKATCKRQGKLCSFTSFTEFSVELQRLSIRLYCNSAIPRLSARGGGKRSSASGHLLGFQRQGFLLGFDRVQRCYHQERAHSEYRAESCTSFHPLHIPHHHHTFLGSSQLPHSPSDEHIRTRDGAPSRLTTGAHREGPIFLRVLRLPAQKHGRYGSSARVSRRREASTTYEFLFFKATDMRTGRHAAHYERDSVRDTPNITT